jgi:hypothetical protein
MMAQSRAEAQDEKEYGPGLPYEPVTRTEFNLLLARVQRLERKALDDDD